MREQMDRPRRPAPEPCLHEVAHGVAERPVGAVEEVPSAEAHRRGAARRPQRARGRATLGARRRRGRRGTASVRILASWERSGGVAPFPRRSRRLDDHAERRLPRERSRVRGAVRGARSSARLDQSARPRVRSARRPRGIRSPSRRRRSRCPGGPGSRRGAAGPPSREHRRRGGRTRTRRARCGGRSRRRRLSVTSKRSPGLDRLQAVHPVGDRGSAPRCRSTA